MYPRIFPTGMHTERQIMCTSKLVRVAHVLTHFYFNLEVKNLCKKVLGNMLGGDCTVYIIAFTKQMNTCRHEEHVTVESVTGGSAPESGRHRRRWSFHVHITAIDIYVCKH
jgi:hypothetical protein